MANCLCLYHITYRWDVIRDILLVCSSGCFILGIGPLPVGTSSFLVLRRFSTPWWGLYFQRGIGLPSQNRNKFPCLYRLSSHCRCLVPCLLFLSSVKLCTNKLANVLYILLLAKLRIPSYITLRWMRLKWDFSKIMKWDWKFISFCCVLTENHPLFFEEFLFLIIVS